MQDTKVEGHLPDDQLNIYDELKVNNFSCGNEIFILTDRINQPHHQQNATKSHITGHLVMTLAVYTSKWSQRATNS